LKPIVIIAEIGLNHNGDFDRAKKMVSVAHLAGADVAKFQTAKAELVMSQYAPKAEYQLFNTDRQESQLEMCRRLHLPFGAYSELKGYCEQLGIEFMSTPFDIPSIRLLDELGQRVMKVPSGEITNLPYLIEIGKLGKPVLLSTGMSELEEIEAAVTVLRKHGTSDITLLHCNTQYPTPFHDANLRAMETLRNEFGLPVGYSDHTPGIEAALAAAALGAVVIEKHFTLDRSMEGPDHKASIEPDELSVMVRSIRNIEAALGDGRKHVTPSERENIEVARKSIVASRDIRAGEVFTEENIAAKRPGSGVSPMRWFEVLGTKAKRDFSFDEMIEID